MINNKNYYGVRKKIVGVAYNILRAVNATVCGGVKEAKKVCKIVKTEVFGANVVIGTNHTL